jgi:argininosuccinate lyase
MTSNANQYTWAGRFSEPVSDLVKRYTASVDFDQRMAPGHPRFAGPRPHAGQTGHHRRRRPGRHRARHGHRHRNRVGKFEWSLDLEGCTSTSRSA